MIRPLGYNNSIVSSRTSGVSQKETGLHPPGVGSKKRERRRHTQQWLRQDVPRPGTTGKGKVGVNTTSGLKSTGKAPREVKGNNRHKGKQRATSQGLHNSQTTLASHPTHGEFTCGVGTQAVNCHVATPSRPQLITCIFFREVLCLWCNRFVSRQ